ncbi:MAG: hypothetical protein M9911_00590 [Saprospiraceae bacterium]|nr:hypothetical protein [Saprospiraceae bacterium]
MKIENGSKENYEIFKEIIPGVQKRKQKFIEIFIQTIVIYQDMNYQKIPNLVDTAAKGCRITDAYSVLLRSLK